eukprot:TRINITY_DN84162_c0_g1_i1.p1 TRINITY_DN84162_c0_g1~~TRINITY_DN84162_c0_g1_i1.p1  ORF type:complete len:211 (+),score=16.10 TRINITY_DN84162_c0_g1_i1:79-633(+)
MVQVRMKPFLVLVCVCVSLLLCHGERTMDGVDGKMDEVADANETFYEQCCVCRSIKTSEIVHTKRILKGGRRGSSTYRAPKIECRSDREKNCQKSALPCEIFEVEQQGCSADACRTCVECDLEQTCKKCKNEKDTEKKNVFDHLGLHFRRKYATNEELKGCLKNDGRPSCCAEVFTCGYEGLTQ